MSFVSLDIRRSAPALWLVIVALYVNAAGDVARAAHQTETFTPVGVGNPYPYQIGLQRYDFGAAPLPTLHSFAAGVHDGKWVLLSGRTNGMHGFANSGMQNFPPQFANQEVWVIDPMTKQSWGRSLATDAGISATLLAELSSTNAQSAQVGDRLYVSGGYGIGATGGFQTFNSLSSIDLPALSNWVMTGVGSAGSAIRTIHDDAFRVTGGAMYAMNGKMHLIFGQNFTGGYNPNSNGVYTNQVRSFEIIDDETQLAIANLTATTPNENYRRRDLNVFPIVHSESGAPTGRGIEVLSGVFTPTTGAWTVPVYIDENGQPSMPDPNLATTFKQAMNNYHSAKLGMYSAQYERMHEILFGGITLFEYDYGSQSFVRDDDFPFTNQITQVTTDAAGSYSQDLIGEFPQILDQEGNRLRFGANAEFFLAEGVPTYDNGVIDLDALTEPTVLGFIYGGIFSNSPHTRNVPGAVSGASNEIFEVIYTPIPEPAAGVVILTVLLLAAIPRCRTRNVECGMPNAG